MSETVHYRGLLQRVSVGIEASKKSAQEILQEKASKEAPQYDNPIEHLCDWWGDEYFYYPKTESLYKIASQHYVELDEEIIEAKTTEDPDEFEYELRYYNGGAGFTECLEEALEKLKK